MAARFLQLVPLELRNASGDISNLKTIVGGQALGPSNPGAKFFLTVTTQTGTTPTLDVFIIKVIDGVQHIMGQFAQVTTTLGASVPIDIANVPDDCQIAWVIGGTSSPAYTFSVWMAR
jgi:hypothetical protein